MQVQYDRFTSAVCLFTIQLKREKHYEKENNRIYILFDFIYDIKS